MDSHALPILIDLKNTRVTVSTWKEGASDPAVQVARLLEAAGSSFDGAIVSAVWDASDLLGALVQQGKRCRIALKPERSGTIGERSMPHACRCETSKIGECVWRAAELS